MQLNLTANSHAHNKVHTLRLPTLEGTALSYQSTLRQKVSCVGVGLHSGQEVSLTIRSAAINEGITFIRTDLAENNRIEARYDYVDSTMMSTRLTNPHGVSIATVEHIMAAMAGMGITNAVIEVNAPEIPIMDGSSLVFCDLIRSVGIKHTSQKVRAIEILKPVRVEDGKGASATFLPDDARTLKMRFDLKGRMQSLIKHPEMSFDLDHDDFHDLLAHARTFGFYEDAQKLLQAGLARGASLDNTIVIRDDAVMNETGLRDEDEFVQHKILDAIGDLSLAGVHIIGAFEGINSGHGLNNQLLRKIFATPNAWCWAHTDFCH